MVRKLLALVFALGIVGVCSAQQDAAPVAQGKTKIMQEKLKHSQKLLEGIALSDFEKISRQAEALAELTNSEDWRVLKTPKYEMFTNEFRRTAESVIAKAKAKNIDGVTLAYFEMTMCCVRCHTHVRETRDTGLRQ